jgi:hypothetical protein
VANKNTKPAKCTQRQLEVCERSRHTGSHCPHRSPTQLPDSSSPHPIA